MKSKSLVLQMIYVLLDTYAHKFFQHGWILRFFLYVI